MGSRFVGNAPVRRIEKNQPSIKSISQCEKYKFCQRAYELVKRWGVKRPAFLAKFSDFGIRVHADLESGTASAPVTRPYLVAWEAWLMENEYHPLHYEYRVGKTFDGKSRSWVGEEYRLFGHPFVVIIDCIVENIRTGRHALVDFKVTSKPEGIREKLQFSTYNYVASNLHTTPDGSPHPGYDIERMVYLIFERAGNLALLNMHELDVTDKILRGQQFRDEIVPIMEGIDRSWATKVFERDTSDCLNCWEKTQCKEEG